MELQRNKQLRILLTWHRLLTGFTFAELLIAALLTGLLSSAIISSLVNMLQVNQQVSSKVTRQQELDRTLDFIGDEIKKASVISTTSALDPSISATGNPVPILNLTVPNPAGTPDYTVTYYLRDNQSPWVGPQVLYRWGPTLNAQGFYNSPPAVANNTAEPLLDLIDGADPSAVCNLDGDGTNNEAADIDGHLNPPVAFGTPKGVYACVADSGKTVNIVLRGQVPNAPANSSIFEVSGQFSARSSN